MRRLLPRLAVLLALGLAGAACGGGDGGGGGGEGAGGDRATTTTAAGRAPTTVRVPADHPTIQAAVDAAVPGDLVLIDPGTYAEEVVVRTERVVLRGLDRNTVVLDGGHELGDGLTVHADGVAVENLTVRNYRFNGVLFVPDVTGEGAYAEADEDAVLVGYRASFVTAVNNGLYGLYAFRAREGVFEDSYASGHPDSGFYVGQCDPCNAVVRRVVAEANVVGFQGTNASGDLYVIESTWRRNRIGIQPNSDTDEEEGPQHDAFVVGNVVADNDDPATPESDTGDFGIGIALGAPIDDLVARNRVTGHGNSGIVLLGENDGFRATGNRIVGNVLEGNGVDLEYVSPAGRSDGGCFAGNTFTTSFPASIEALLPCEGARGTVEAARTSQRLPVPKGVDHRTLPAPGPQPSMPDAATRPAEPAGKAPRPDVDAIPVPTG